MITVGLRFTVQIDKIERWRHRWNRKKAAKMWLFKGIRDKVKESEAEISVAAAPTLSY